MGLRIDKVDHTEPAVRERIVAFLAPHEAHALFILGNLMAGFAGSNLYVASRSGEWLGVAGFYEGPASLIPFSTDADVVRALVRHVAERRPDLRFMNGIDYVAEPAYDELLSLGFAPGNDPRQVFMERDGEPPPQRLEEHARPFAPEDAEAVARLMRHMRGAPDDGAPPTEKERASVLGAVARAVLVLDGRPVATASTNGLALRAFQVLGVVTHPDFRRRGCARAVCAALMREMRRRGAEKTVLFTGIENAAARACYKGLGFRETGGYYVARLRRP